MTIVVLIQTLFVMPICFDVILLITVRATVILMLMLLLVVSVVYKEVSE